MIRENQELKEAFDALEEAFGATGIDFYMIGAQAKDIWYAKEKILSRRTKDVDFAVLVANSEDYQKAREYLVAHGKFTETKANAFVLLSPAGIQVDILPFGEIEIGGAVTMQGAGLTSISVDGFKEVYQAGTGKEQTQTGHSFKVATLPAIVLLKLIAYDDRPEMRLKDAVDISGIIEHYFELQADNIYNNHLDLFADEDSGEKLDHIAATVIGREIKTITGTNKPLLDRLVKILQGHISAAQNSPFIRAMTGISETVEDKIKLLERILHSLEH